MGGKVDGGWRMGNFFSALIGNLAPIRTTGRLLLEHELRKHGLDTTIFSTTCLQELTDTIVADAKRSALLLGENWKSTSVEYIENLATLIAGILAGEIKEDDEVFDAAPIIATLRKHGVRVKP